MPVEPDPAIKKIADKLPVPVQPAIKKNLPTFDGSPGRKYTDNEIDEILDYLLQFGKVPAGTARERMQRNYPKHRRLLERAVKLKNDGKQLHTSFGSRGFWRGWASVTGTPISPGAIRSITG